MIVVVVLAPGKPVVDVHPRRYHLVEAWIDGSARPAELESFVPTQPVAFGLPRERVAALLLDVVQLPVVFLALVLVADA